MRAASAYQIWGAIARRVAPADASSGVDARSQHKAQMPGLRRACQPRRVHQPFEPGISRRRSVTSTYDEGAVEALERHHIVHGAEPDQIEESDRRSGSVRSAVQKLRRRNSRLTATSVKKTSPTAARYPSPERSSARFGLTMATAGGSGRLLSA